MDWQTLYVGGLVVATALLLVLKARWHHNRRHAGRRLPVPKRLPDVQVVRPENPQHPRRKARVFRIEDVQDKPPEGE